MRQVVEKYISVVFAAGRTEDILTKTKARDSKRCLGF